MTAYRFPPPATVTAIVDEVIADLETQGFKLTAKQLQQVAGRSTEWVAWVRFEIWWRIRQLPTRWGKPYSYPQIAEWFGCRDHGAVLHGVKRWQDKLDAEARAKVDT